MTGQRRVLGVLAALVCLLGLVPAGLVALQRRLFAGPLASAWPAPAWVTYGLRPRVGCSVGSCLPVVETRWYAVPAVVLVLVVGVCASAGFACAAVSTTERRRLVGLLVSVAWLLGAAPAVLLVLQRGIFEGALYSAWPLPAWVTYGVRPGTGCAAGYCFLLPDIPTPWYAVPAVSAAVAVGVGGAAAIAWAALGGRGRTAVAG